MLAFIKTNYRVGDRMEITSTEGTFFGEIEYVTDKYIVLRQPNGQICGIASAGVLTFRAEQPVAQVPHTIPVTVEPVTEESEEVKTEAVNVDEPAAEDVKVENPVENAESSTAGIVEPKVVGHIDLDKLQRIDPKFGRRRYFRNEEEFNQGDQEEDSANEVSGADESECKKFVPANGRITFYNVDKKYGFIADYNSGNSLYFNLSFVVDRDLCESLRKGTKVAYTIDTNSQGYTARFVHLPKSFSDLLLMAEDQLGMRRIQTARGLIEHVLAVDPENQQAKALLEEVNDVVPVHRFAHYDSVGSSVAHFNTNQLYAKAKKAYLDKNYVEAEKSYLEAIEANEKVESCIKDLVTLYVSAYKKAVEDDEKETYRQKAIDFLNDKLNLLPDNLTTRQFLALNYYLPILDFENFIRVVDEILADPQVSSTLSRRVFFMWQKGIALNKMGRSSEALELVSEGLALAPRSRHLLNLKYAIENPEMFRRGDNWDSEGEAVPETEEKEVAMPNEVIVVEENQPEQTMSDSADVEPSQPDSQPVEAQNDSNTGEPKPDSWWDSLNNRF